MSHRVPGGRQRAASDGDILDEEDEDIYYNMNDQQQQRLRHGGDAQQDQFGRYGLPSNLNNVSKYVETRHSSSDINSDNSVSKKKKGIKKPFKSLSNFMHKVARSVTNSMNGGGNSRGTSSSFTKRSQSMRDKNYISPYINSPQQLREITVNRSHSNPLSKTRPTITRKKPTSKYPVIKINNRIPGTQGIKNHGNTCFMNAVLQCLGHTDIIAEYFVTDQYKNDLMRHDRANAKKFGSKGEITENLALLLKSLWSCEYSPDISNSFKAVVGKHGSQYRGYSQHDAQEFLLWLLDKVHEDLNTATKKKYRANKSSYGRPDDIVAAEALANHMRNNNSFLYDLFQALYRSSLICPCCNRQSNTFDPFLCVSLPIPQKTYRPVFITVVYLDAQPKQVRIGLTMDSTCYVYHLRQRLAEDTGIPTNQIVLCEIYYDGFHRTFRDEQPFADIHETDNVFAVEVCKPYIETLPPNQYPSNDYLILTVLNKAGTGSHAKKFGPPIVLQVPRDIRFIDLQSKIFQTIQKVARPPVNPQLESNIHLPPKTVMVRMKVSDGITGKCYLPDDVECPLYMQTVDRALTVCGNAGGPMHIKVTVEWEHQPYPGLFERLVDHIEEHSSVPQAKQAQLQPIIYTLDECFQLYTKEERLGAEDAWMCPGCQKRQRGTIKKLNLWSLPDILVVHLKRFKQIGIRRTKLNSLTSFPIEGLDMSKHVVKRDEDSQLVQMYMTLSPWRRQRWTPPCDDDYIYDLYAVCNHYGTMLGGHYTAFTKNPTDGNWYSFDDDKVTEIPESEIVTRTAYMLFYQRRTLTSFNPRENINNDGVQDHWVTRMPRFDYEYSSKVISRSEENLLDDAPSSTMDRSSLFVPKTTLKNFERRGMYQSLPRKLNSSLSPTRQSTDLDTSAPELLPFVGPRLSSTRSTASSPPDDPSARTQSDFGYGLVVNLPTKHQTKGEDVQMASNKVEKLVVALPPENGVETLKSSLSPIEKTRPSSLSSGHDDNKPQKHVTISDDVFVNGTLTPTKPPALIDGVSPPVSTSSPREKVPPTTTDKVRKQLNLQSRLDNKKVTQACHETTVENVDMIMISSDIQVIEPIPKVAKPCKPIVAPKPVVSSKVENLIDLDVDLNLVSLKPTLEDARTSSRLKTDSVAYKRENTPIIDINVSSRYLVGKSPVMHRPNVTAGAKRSTQIKRTPSKSSKPSNSLNGYHPVLAMAIGTMKPLANRNHSMRSTGTSSDSRCSSYTDSSSGTEPLHQPVIRSFTDKNFVANVQHMTGVDNDSNITQRLAYSGKSSTSAVQGSILNGQPPVKKTNPPAVKPKPVKQSVDLQNTSTIIESSPKPAPYLTETCV